MAQKIGNALAFFVFDHWFEFNLELWYYPLGSKMTALVVSGKCMVVCIIK